MFTPIKPIAEPPAPSPSARANARKQRFLLWVIGALLGCAALMLLLPLKLPLAARLAIAAGDVITALLVGVAYVQSRRN